MSTDHTDDIDLSPLFCTPQIHTSPQGVHTDDAGNEYDALLIEGEWTFLPTRPARGGYDR